MTRTSSRSGKGWRRSAARLRTLDAAQLQSVSGGIIIVNSTGGLIAHEYKPSESLRLFPDTGE